MDRRVKVRRSSAASLATEIVERPGAARASQLIEKAIRRAEDNVMPNSTSESDRAFAVELESLEWSPSEFNHRLHVRLAYIYLCQASQDDAYHAMRDWTFRYLAHHNIDPGKYNETLTRAWMLAVRHFMARTPHSQSSEHFLEQNPDILDSTIMMTHYSNDLLWSDEARREFVEPDLDPIPRHPDADS